jgi:hypothetical protein
MFADDLGSKESRAFGWYTKHLAVGFSFGFAILLLLAVLVGFIPGLSAVPGGLIAMTGPAPRIVDLFLAAASSGYDCDTNWWDDRLLELVSLGLFAFLAWLEYFAIGIVTGAAVDVLLAIKRRLFRVT